MRGIGIFLITAVLVVGMAGCVTAGYEVTGPDAEGSEVTSPGYDVTAPNTEGSEVTGSGEETFAYVDVTVPGPDFGATLTGPINEEGYIFPSDLQRHSFFTGTT